jgi:hypothetical protein
VPIWQFYQKSADWLDWPCPVSAALHFRPIKYELKLPSEVMPGLLQFRSRYKQCGASHRDHPGLTRGSNGAHTELTRSSHGAHTGLTRGSHGAHTGITRGSHGDHTGITWGSHRAHTGLTRGSHRAHTRKRLPQGGSFQKDVSKILKSVQTQ